MIINAYRCSGAQRQYKTTYVPFAIAKAPGHMFDFAMASAYSGSTFDDKTTVHGGVVLETPKEKKGLRIPTVKF